jgi:hypothetical protein
VEKKEGSFVRSFLFLPPSMSVYFTTVVWTFGDKFFALLLSLTKFFVITTTTTTNQELSS